VFEHTVGQARRDDRAPLNVFVDRDGIHAWARRLELTVVDLRDGDEPFVPLPQPLTLTSGAVMEKFGNLGQSICVLEKPY
jgi:hypothetical protein